nr:lytic transglycosylase domain-containing protein [Sphingomonas sp. Y57]
MAALILALVAGTALASAVPRRDPLERWRPHIDEAAARFQLPPAWIEKVIRAESAGRSRLNGRPIRSRAGAMGLMQLMPATWATMRGRLKLGDDPDDPRDNILAGSAYLRLMLDRFGYPGLFGAYNLGPTGYARYLAGQRALPKETSDYLAKLVGHGPPIAKHVPARPREALFTFRAGSTDREADQVPPPTLFVIHSDAR